MSEFLSLEELKREFVESYQKIVDIYPEEEFLKDFVSFKENYPDSEFGMFIEIPPEKPENGVGYLYSDELGYHLEAWDREKKILQLCTRKLRELKFWVFLSVSSVIARRATAESRGHDKEKYTLIPQIMSLLGENYKKMAEIEVEEQIQMMNYQNRRNSG